jgi:pSer/pThr/pTyr-binding forkhead associated (FHA) protein
MDRYASTPAELRDRLMAERRGAPFLVFRDGAGAQVIVDLGPPADRLVIGRREGCELALRWDAEVSRLHAQLERVGGDWVVCDEGLSHNGTFVNGERVLSRRRLRDGDVITVGGTVMSFSAPGHTRASATQTTQGSAAVALTPAQRRVLVELCRPMAAGRYAAPASNRRIAERLYVSLDTVKGTMRGLFDLFEVDDLPQNEKRAVLAARALERGAIDREELV